MNTKQLDAEIRARIDQFLVSISGLVRQASVEAVREALGDTPGTTTAAARRGPARSKKAAAASSAAKATLRHSAAPKGKAAAAKPATATPTRRIRRSSADVEAVAANAPLGLNARVEYSGLAPSEDRCLDVMKKWVVKVPGEGFLIAYEDGIIPSGFYTTRYVEANTAELAESAAIDLIRDDAELTTVVKNTPEDSPMLYAESIREVPSFEGVTPPGSGYTFFRASQARE